jgi:Tol biopolymer transport system component
MERATRERRTLWRLLSMVVAATVLTTAGVLPAHATASGENGRIVFRRYLNDAHTKGDIFTIKADGTGERRLTHVSGEGNLATEPDWSPDGKWISYDIWQHGNSERSRIFKVMANGSHPTNIDGSCIRPCLTDGFQQWSRDGKWIAFQRALGPSLGVNNVQAIFVMRADGKRVRRITQKGADPAVSQPYQDNAPTWSPMDKRLAFVRHNLSTDHSAIFTVHLDGTGLQRVTPWRLDAGQPDWSPNGRWIVFYGPTSSDIRHVAIVHPNGKGLRIVIGAPGTWGSLSFSPAGGMITAAHSPGVGSAGNADVYTLKLDGSDLKNVTNSSAFESAPDWGPSS